ncbi:MAG: hypothetical protein BGN92_11525 [Sphingobacteriales bacterium 41-5]|nr:MAG: hypothetical protein BGN92_11525 [Sphingobacteriales bacterium 41-5]
MTNYKLKILPSAKKDWQEARIRYKQQNSNLSSRFNEQIKATAIQICQLPFSHAVSIKMCELQILGFSRMQFII